MPTTSKVSKTTADAGFKLADLKHSEPIIAGKADLNCEAGKPDCLIAGHAYITGEDLGHRIYVACANGVHLVKADEAGDVIGFTRAPKE